MKGWRMAKGLLRHSVIRVAIDLLEPNAWNPQKMDDTEFELLVSNIREVGFIDPVAVCPLPGGRYRIVNGEHRWRAAKVLGMKEIPVVVLEDWEEDLQKAQTVKLNILRGKLDPVKFSKLFDSMAAKHGEELTKQMFGFKDEAMFRAIYQSVKAGLPKDLADKVDKSRKEIRTVDDLGNVLNAIFATHGSTLDHGFLIFSFLGKDHIYVEMNAELRKRVLVLTEQASAEGRKAGEVFLEVLG